jgi:hypothetical protein
LHVLPEERAAGAIEPAQAAQPVATSVAAA